MNTRVVPLSVEAEEFSLRTVPIIWVPDGKGSDGSRNCVPSREIHRGVVGRNDAVVSTTAVAGAAPPAEFAGTDVLAVAGMKFPAVAEVYSSAIDDEGAPLVIRNSKQRGTVVEVDPVWPVGECRGLVDDMTVPEPLEHSVVGLPIEVGHSYVDRVAAPNPIEHSGVRGTVDPPSASQLMLHSVVSGDWRTGRQDHPCDDRMPLNVRMEDRRSSPDDGEAIVVGAVGSAAPWFLTGWAEEVEIEFMINAGCQVTILATSVFERIMCVRSASEVSTASVWMPAGFG